MKQRIKSSAPPGTQAVTRAIAILKAMAQPRASSAYGFGITELAIMLELNKAAVFRLLGALEVDGMVIRDTASGAYRLGPALITLGASALGSTDLSAAAHDELLELVRQTGETSTLEVLIGSEVLLISEVQGHFLLSGNPELGLRWPAHATATGKVLLALTQSAKIPAELVKRTARTIGTSRDLEQELERIRNTGYAIATDELEIGFTAVAAPVRNHFGSVVAAISINGATSRMHGTALQALVELVRDAADRVSRRLGATAAMLEHQAAAGISAVDRKAVIRRTQRETSPTR
ncbi:MAG: IclR family transcriptional regulator [Gemmatimonadaceae bacterium]